MLIIHSGKLNPKQQEGLFVVGYAYRWDDGSMFGWATEPINGVSPKLGYIYTDDIIGLAKPELFLECESVQVHRTNSIYSIRYVLTSHDLHRALTLFSRVCCYTASIGEWLMECGYHRG